MSSGQDDKNLLVRDGTGQDKRLPDALRTDYVSVDERGEETFVEFAHKFAEQVRYYNTKDEAEGDWQAFFPVKKDPNNPHYALYLTFVALIKKLQEQVNTLTQRHLDFFYEEVLRLSPKQATPDQVHMVFELAKNVAQHRLPAGTLLKAGKDGFGKQLYFRTLRDLVINKGTVASLRTVFVANAGDAIYASPMANTQYSLGQEELDDSVADWHSFGYHPPKTFTEININREPENHLTYNSEINARLGFALSSPLLWLQQGERTITLVLEMKQAVETSLASISNIFEVSLTGAKGWLVIPQSQLTVRHAAKSKTLSLQITLSAEDAPVVAYSEEAYQEDYATQYPMMRVVVKKLGILQELTKAKVNSADLTVKVQGAKELLLQSDEGIIDPNKPFRPYGGNPELGTGFYVGYPEAFHKKLTEFSINLTYKGIANGNLIAYYERYFEDKGGEGVTIIDFIRGTWLPIDALEKNEDFLVGNITKEIATVVASAIDALGTFIAKWEDGDVSVDEVKAARDQLNNLLEAGKTSSLNSVNLPEQAGKVTEALYGFLRDYYGTNSIFRAQPYYLDKKAWVPLDSDISLFDEADATQTVALQFLKSGTPGFGAQAYQRYLSTEIPTGYDVGTARGFVKLELSGPESPFRGFGHKAYTRLYTKSIISLTNEGVDDDLGIPNEPYTPTIKSISLDYTSTVNFPIVSTKSTAEQFFQVGPFGQQQVAGPSRILGTDAPFLLPNFDNRGNLYVGLQDVKPGSSVSLLIRVSEGTGDGDLEKDNVIWWVLNKGEKWEQLRRNVLSDSTNELLNSGIISIAIPETATLQSTYLGKNKVWLRATVKNSPETENKLVAVHAQAVTAEFTDAGNDPNRLGTPLEAESISKLKVKEAEIKKVKQLYASFGGKKEEADNSFYTRVSERLRHKNRAINIWDYERLVLDEFPSVYKVKCLNHTNLKSERAPGYVTMVIVSNLRNQNAVNPLKPLTSQSTLAKIRDHLLQFNTPFLGLQNAKGEDYLIVRNPDFEEIRVDFKVRFIQSEGLDAGYLLGVLEQAIIRFLAPWAYDDGVDITFEGRIHKSMILNFVEKLDYVDYVSCFKMFHHVDGEEPVERDEIEPSRSSTILVSHPQHNIDDIKNDEGCECEGEAPIVTTQPDGIGTMVVRRDFEVR